MSNDSSAASSQTPTSPASSASSAVPSRPLAITVMGAGAVGCYFGARMAQAGHNVTLIARAQHVAAIQQHGLRLETRTSDTYIQQHLSATDSPAAAQDADVVLFCVKSTDTVPAAQALQPHLRADTLVLSMQNGVDNADRLRAVLAQPVSAAVVYVATEMAGPGHVKHHGRGELIIEPADGADRLAAAFQSAGVPTEVSQTVRTALWSKLLINCAYNALSAIARQPYGPLSESAGIAQVMQDVVREGLAVAAAEGIPMPADLPDTVAKLAATMPGQFSSTAQDLMRGKPTEIDYLNGTVVRRGEALGVPTPANRVLWALVKLLEARPIQ